MNQNIYKQYAWAFNFLFIITAIAITVINIVFTSQFKYAITLGIAITYILITKIHSFIMRISDYDGLKSMVPILFTKMGVFVGIVFWTICFISLVTQSNLHISDSIFFSLLTIGGIGIATSMSMLDVILVLSSGTPSTSHYPILYINRLR